MWKTFQGELPVASQRDYHDLHCRRIVFHIRRGEITVFFGTDILGAGGSTFRGSRYSTVGNEQVQYQSSAVPTNAYGAQGDVPLLR